MLQLIPLKQNVIALLIKHRTHYPSLKMFNSQTLPPDPSSEQTAVPLCWHGLFQHPVTVRPAFYSFVILLYRKTKWLQSRRNLMLQRTNLHHNINSPHTKPSSDWQQAVHLHHSKNNLAVSQSVLYTQQDQDFVFTLGVNGCTVQWKLAHLSVVICMVLFPRLNRQSAF